MRIGLLLALASVGVAPALAEHCEGYTTSEPYLVCGDVCAGSAAAAGGHYVFVEGGDCPSGCIYSLWVYEESNGLAGLQRGDEMHDDTCHESVAPDRIAF